MSGSVSQFVIFGDGPDASQLYFPSLPSNSFAVTANLNSSGQSYYVHDLSFVTGQQGAAVGFQVNQSQCLSAFPASEMFNVKFRGVDNTGNFGSDYWSSAYSESGLSGDTLHNVTIWGGANHGNGIVFAGNTTGSPNP